MVGSLWWNNLSVKHKLFSLVLLPVTLLLFLAGQQVYRLSIQSQDFARAQLFSDYMDEISYLYNLSFRDTTNNGSEIQKATQALNTKTAAIFAGHSSSGSPSTDNVTEVQQLLSSFEEASLSLATVTDTEERLDISEWRADTYKQILLALEKVPFDNATFEIKSHLTALIQLDWLMFWSTEENRLSGHLIHTMQQNQNYDAEISNEIQTLVQNQQLFLERFVTLNANQQQVSMLLDTFTNDVFVTSQEFRSFLFNEQPLLSLSPQEVASGLTALSNRFTLLQDVDNKIEQQLKADVNHATTIANRQRLLFIGIMSVITILVISLAVGLVRKVTGDLNLVVKFLSQDSHSEASLLSELVKGKDELSRFAQEVEKLSYEREQAKLKLTRAKEEAEQAKDDAIRASKAKSSFLANMSHEIRTPLNGVIGISEVLSETSLTAAQRDYVNTIETSSQLLLSLINDILDFSKIESGMLLSSPHSTCIRESIYDTAAIIMPKAKQKGIDLQISISRNTPSHLMVDDHRLRQVLMNFMSNAVKFTTKGSVHLSVTCHSVIDARAVVEFAVQDSGIGIDTQQQQKIFEPFAQEDESTTRQYGGTGLGLAISTQLIELMGSKIQLESQKGRGSRFFFLLDVAIGQMDFEAKPAVNDCQIWLVCDDEKMTNTLRDELSFYRIDVHQSVNNLAMLPPRSHHREGIMVIYMESQPNMAAANAESLNKLATQDVRLCLLTHFSSTEFDFSENICRIAQPLMGQRLVKTLQHCANQLNQQTSASETPQPAPAPVAASVTVAKKESISSDKADSMVPNRPERILLVEDNAVNQKVSSLLLKKAGYHFEIAENGQIAVEMFQQDSSFDIILMDCMMPVMDGFEATREIREYEKNSGLPKTPIIALTASVIDDDIQRCYDSGMDAYVPKPVRKEKLLHQLESVTTA